ncbi:hypothetical protein QTP70_034404 [Hemibagrus guttatus]|uniref:Uncharacterized protein n=1 Tax=Hemibagrus guttatus TaxID=175788 RepID=A0AAE0QTR8_9TELE|nr:hypothetical protein QTP70_034404 [Hemibagrus guttatus]
MHLSCLLSLWSREKGRQKRKVWKLTRGDQAGSLMVWYTFHDFAYIFNEASVSLQLDSPTQIKSPLPSSSDQNIRGEIKTSFYPECGKRLRHEIFKHSNKPLNHGGLKAYHNLRYFEVVNVPTTCEKPDLSLAGIDPFRSSSLDEKTAEDSRLHAKE